MVRRDKMKFTIRIWLLIIFVALSLVSIFSIPPTFLEKGILVSSVEENSSVHKAGLVQGMKILEINNVEINELEDYENFASTLPSTKQKVIIKTDQSEVIGLFNKDFTEEFTVSEISKTRLRTGLDVQGGARALVFPDVPITENQLDDLISVSQERFNVFGLTDVQIRKVSDLSGNRFMLVEIAGSSPDDLEELITNQGKFEAKIGDKIVFIGGEKDVTYVGRSGQDATISSCFAVEGGEACNFQFTIYLSEEAAQRHADITGKLSLGPGGYLNETIDFYLDGILTESLNIGQSLQGQVATQIQISGSETGLTRKEAIDNAELQMKKLQTVLITGSLPLDLQIEKIDRISPRLGEEFSERVILAGLSALLAVFILIFIRYRKLKTSLAVVAVSFSEVLIILGIASLIKWNLDLPSIAGIIATIGTGIDSQLVILDESRIVGGSVAQRIKKALFIIATAFATTFVALIPLTGALSFMGIGAASAGLLKGFAVTTLIGITAGILITRPAFADIAKQIEENK